METNTSNKIKCEECNGEGYIIHPDWKEFMKKWEDYKGEPSKIQIISWFLLRGHRYVPRKRRLCLKCKGTGWIQIGIPEGCEIIFDDENFEDYKKIFTELLNITSERNQNSKK